MAESDAPRLAYEFFRDHLLSQDTFTKTDVGNATGWAKGAYDTYWSKQFRHS